MGAETGIAWTDHTFNPWWGCVRVSPGCTNCYAEAWDKSRGGSEKHWGPTAGRRFFGDAHWNEPLKWDRAAAAAGTRARVFCSSMADVFEDRRDLDAQRERLWDLIHATPNLDWQLLTKRPEQMRLAVPKGWWAGWPSNVWAGTTVEDQQRADERVPELLKVPARVRFLSVEPLLERVTFRWARWTLIGLRSTNHLDGLKGIGWVIVGGESGPGARAFDVRWARELVAQCQTAHVPVFVKQLGAFTMGEAADVDAVLAARGRGGGGCPVGAWRLALAHPKGGDMAEWPAALRVREFPVSPATTTTPRKP